MEHLLNKRVRQIEISGIRKFFNLVSDVDDVVPFTIGQPDFPTPNHVKQAGIKAIEQNFTTYTHNAGYMEVRKAASDFVKTKYGLDYDPKDEIIITTGASEAIDIALRTILEEGAEVILPGPVYPGYEPIIRLCGGIPVYADTRETGFKLTAAVLESYLTERTKCVILPYPSNPTGVSLTEEELSDIAQLLHGRDIFILADEIYSELVYDKPHCSIANKLRSQTIVINGLSKSHAMTGWRIGMVFAPRNIARHLLKVHQYNVSCASSISQAAAFEALTAGIDDAASMRDEYRRRRDYVASRLTDFGLQAVMPDGAFYFFVQIPEELKQSSFDFALGLARDGGVAVVPGSAFSELGEGYFRLSYACSMDTIKKGLDRLEMYLNNIHAK